jgi:cytochrome P450
MIMATKFVEDAEDIELMAFDPFGPAFRQNPEKHHAMLFENSPGYIDMEGVPSAFIASYAQCIAVLRDFKTFSSIKPNGLPGMQRIDFFNGLPVMNYSDPPDHTRRRKVVNPAFTPMRTALLLENAEIMTDSLIDRVLAKGGEFDAMEALCKPFSIDTQLSKFLAIAPEDQAIFLRYVQTIPLLDSLKLGDPKPQAYLDAWKEGAAFCKRQQELARQGKCESLIGVIAAGADGGALSEDEMMAMMIVLLIGGVSTIAGAVAVALMNMAKYPDVADRVRRDPDAAALVLEESLRMDPPVSLVMRFCQKPTEIGGKLILKGMPTYVMIATACHDPEKFPDPYRFDIDRENLKDHIAFGQGMHTCIGNAIARAVGPMVIRKVANRIPNLRLADRPDAIQWDTSTPRARHIDKLFLQV